MSDLTQSLAELDRALERVVEAVPWAERDSNRVVWGEADVLPDDRAPAGVRDLFLICSSVQAADAGSGWFVHMPRNFADHDEYVPHRIAGRGPCWPLGSDGGGGWFVVEDGGGVLLLRPGHLAANEYRPWSDDDVVELCADVGTFVDMVRTAALAMVESDC